MSECVGTGVILRHVEHSATQHEQQQPPKPLVVLDGCNARASLRLLVSAFRFMYWIDANQLGRRNLTPDAASLLRGRRYNRAEKHQGARTDLTSAQNEPKSTAKNLAKKHGVSTATIKRDGHFAKAVETLKPHVPDIERRVVTGHLPTRFCH